MDEDKETLVHTDSDHPAHKDIFKTLDLLAIDTAEGPAFFVVEGLSTFGSLDEVQGLQEYFYEEHSCPTNFIRVEMIARNGDYDPHGLFRHVRTVWLTQEYLEALDEGREEEYLLKVFPELTTTTGTGE